MLRETPRTVIRMPTVVRSVPAVAPRRLSEIRLIDDGCVGFGQILRSFSFNSPHQGFSQQPARGFTSVPIPRPKGFFLVLGEKPFCFRVEGIGPAFGHVPRFK